MSVETYTHILHVWLVWLKVHRRLILGAAFGLLTCVHVLSVSESITDALLLVRMKQSQPEKVQIYAPSKKRIIRRRRVSVTTVPTSSASSSSSSEFSRRPFVPRGMPSSSSSRERLRRAAPEIDPRTESGSVQSSSSSAASSMTSSVTRMPTEDFPPFLRTVMPVTKVPNWGNMRTPEEWNRTYAEMEESDFVMLPSYNLDRLTDETMEELLQTRNDPHSIQTLTEKLTWSTRFFGAYDLDASEFTAVHPGLDIKLAEGTPIASIAGGRVNAVNHKNSGLGLHVIVEHRLPDGSQYFAIYGHLGEVSVSVGDTVKPGQIIGKVGMTGKTTAPHLHLQIDKGFGEEFHVPNTPDHVPTPAEARRFWAHPAEFIRTYN